MADKREDPPDGGWGWVVMLASLGCLTIRTGLTWAAFPIMYADLIQYFQTSSAAVGWTGSIFSFCNFAVCLMATPFYEAYGSRLLGVVGTLMSSLGLIMTACAPNLAILFLAYGVVAGGAVCLQITASTDLVGVEQAAQATSLLMVATSLAVLMALPLAGWLYDVSGSYDIPFVVNGLLQVVGACCVLCVIPCRRKTTKGQQSRYHLPNLVEVADTQPWQSTHSLAI